MMRARQRRLDAARSTVGRVATSAIPAAGIAAASLFAAANASAVPLSGTTFQVQTGSSGEISSLKLVGDAFDTNYVLNASNAPGQNTADHEWLGELMFAYKLGGAAAWTTALTNLSTDARKVTSTATSVTVTYQNAANAKGIRNFKLVETYSLVNDYLDWQIALTNTSNQSIEFGDVGLPLPFNEYFFGNDVIYEQRVLYHSFTGNNSSFITVKRPSGVGPFLLMTPVAATGARFEYMDAWRDEEHPGSAWAGGGGTPAWPNGLDVFYIHSSAIKSTNRGYLPNTSLTLPAGQTKTYEFKFFKVASEAEVKDRLYTEGLIDVTVVPSMMFATNMTGKLDLHTSKPINSVTAQYPAETKITALPAGPAGADHHLYQISLAHLGQNDVTVSYGDGETTTLQFAALEPIDKAIQRHATFMVNSTQAPSGDMQGVFDDWMMSSKSRRGATGGWGWGDDWGWTHGEFLAEKNSQTPVAAEVTALDKYLDAVWARSIDHSSYVVQDWWCPAGTSPSNLNNCYYDRAYAYPHAFNTYFAMYKIASRYPALVSYHNPADTYLMRAYHILHTLYSGHGDPGTGYMGEQTLPEIAQALSDAGHAAEAQQVKGVLQQLYQAFKGNPYPYGSEYSYDNTGEEAVYTAAKANDDSTIMGRVNAKTRACRGQQPTWYYYADPVTLNGENWWQFQYTAALAGHSMDDWLKTHSTAPEEDERLSYAAKMANISAINSGQIDSNPANLGAVSWTYQAMKGNHSVNYADNQSLHNDWWQMSGEADLGLFGAIRILSADVAVDPVFGLFGYGCDVTKSGSLYSITPKDGVFKRLNLITEKLYVELDRDQYTSAQAATSKDYLALTLDNQATSSAHTTKITLAGFAAGTYDVRVDGAKIATLDVTSDQPSIVSIPVDMKPSYDVEVGTPPIVSGGTASASTGAGGSSGADASTGAEGSTEAGPTAAPGSGGSVASSGGPGSGGEGGAQGMGATASGCSCETGSRSNRDGLGDLRWPSCAVLGILLSRRRQRRSARDQGRRGLLQRIENAFRG